jgi:hypothetical protein
MDYETEVIDFVELQVDALIGEHNEMSEKQILLTMEIGKTLKLYLFLIFYKLNMFLLYHVNIISKKDYLKDYLTFSSRHTNEILYNRAKEILKEHYDVDTKEKVYEFLFKPSILEKFYERAEGEEEDETDFDEDGNYKYNFDANSTDLPEDDPNFGNPLFSMMSYFKYFDVKEDDWLREAKHDVFSTTFDLKNDEVLLENRLFMFEINFFLKNNMTEKFQARDLTLKNLHAIVNNYYGTNMKQMITLTKHPSKNKLTRRATLPSKLHRSATAKIGPTSKYNTLKSRTKSKSKAHTQGKKPSPPKRLSVIVEGEE